MRRLWFIGCLVALSLCALPRRADAQAEAWYTGCPLCAQHYGSPSVNGPFDSQAKCQQFIADGVRNGFRVEMWTPCHAGAGAAAGSTPEWTTGSPVGDALAFGANMWIVQNIQNPYGAIFAQSFAKGFLTSLFGDSDTPEARRQRDMAAALVRRRQQEAAERARIEAQQRIDAMFARLNSQLKLDGHSTQLALKSDGPVQTLVPKLSGGTSDGGLTLKLGSDSPQGFGIAGLPGIYVGGPAHNGDAAASTADPKLKAGDASPPGFGITGLPGIYIGGPSGPSATAAAPTGGIAGLPGVYLGDVAPARAAQLANTTTTLTGAERSAVQDAALQAAQKTPALTGPTDDPLVRDYQQKAHDYTEASAQRQDAWQKATEAEGHVRAEQAAIDYARDQIAAAPQGSPLTASLQQLLGASQSDEAAAANARNVFDQADVRLWSARGTAADALARLAPPPIDVPVQAVPVGPFAAAPRPAAAVTAPAATRPPVSDLRVAVSVPPPALTPVEDDRETQAYLAAAKKECDGSPKHNCEFLYAEKHKNDAPALYLSRRNAEHYLFAKSTCQGEPGAEWRTWGITIPAPVTTEILALAIPGYSLRKALSNLLGSAAFVNSPATAKEVWWEYKGLTDCLLLHR